MMLAGWAAIAAAILTVTGLVTLLAFFGSGSAVLGALNDLNTIAMALVVVPVALALLPLASRASVSMAILALVLCLIGVGIAAGFSALLLTRIISGASVLTIISVGNGLIGMWLLMTAALLLAAAAVPTALGWLGVAGGAGLAVAAFAFPLLDRQHPAVGLAGLVGFVGLVGFYAWAGAELLHGRIGTG